MHLPGDPGALGDPAPLLAALLISLGPLLLRLGQLGPPAPGLRYRPAGGDVLAAGRHEDGDSHGGLGIGPRDAAPSIHDQAA